MEKSDTLIDVAQLNEWVLKYRSAKAVGTVMAIKAARYEWGMRELIPNSSPCNTPALDARSNVKTHAHFGDICSSGWLMDDVNKYCVHKLEGDARDAHQRT